MPTSGPSAEGNERSPIKIFNEFQASVELIPTNELNEAFDFAALINRGGPEKFNYNFQALLLALVYGRHGISEWFRNHISNSGVDLVGMLSDTRFRGKDEEVRRLASEHVDPVELYKADRRTATASAFSWIEKAKRLAVEQKHAQVGLRQLMGAVIFTPEFHKEELDRWHFDRTAWANDYLGYVQKNLPADFDFWKSINQQVFHSDPALPIGSALQKPAYLLTWNPAKFPFSNFERQAREADERGEVELGWSTGNRETVTMGARVFLMRQGEDPRGLVGAGWIIGSVSRQPHWDPEQREAGKTYPRVLVKWQTLAEMPVLPLDQLLSEFGQPALWAAPAGGVEIPSEVVPRLDQAWQTASARRTAGQPRAKPGPKSGQAPAGSPGSAVIAAPLSFFDPATAVSESLPDLANDRVDGEPYIDIKADVQSIARVICMQQVNPPLSIALFGNWGSGKSFFMAQLHKEVEKISKSDDAGPKGKPFFKDIIQIEFNAWHYVEADLWASLVSHIFENLKSPGEQNEAKQKQEQEALLEKLGSAQKLKEEAEQKLDEAKKQQELAQQELERKEATRQEKLLTLEDVKAGDFLKTALSDHEKDIAANLADVQTKLGLHRAISTLDEARKALDEAKEVGGDAAKFIRAFISAPGSRGRMGFVLLSACAVIVIPAVFTIIAKLNQWQPWTDSVKWLTTMFGVIATLSKPVRETTRNLRSVLEKLRAANERFESVIKEKAKEQEEGLRTARAGVASAAQEVAAAKSKLKEAEGAIVAAEGALTKASPRGLLNAFIEERAASDDYRKKLGMLALVRRDFEKLSKLLTNVREDPSAAEHQNLPRIDRIILYIDDLDRCPPKQVVEVLQAIHLLLAFELFVVVVGVDPRWICRSLKKHYPELLGDDLDVAAGRSHQSSVNASVSDEADSPVTDRARPLDYLEKIFQIPFWIKPIGDRETGALIKGLLTPTGQLRPALTQAPVKQREGTQPIEAKPGIAVPPSRTEQPDNRPRSNAAAPSSAIPASSMEQKTATVSKSEDSFAGTILSDAEVKFLTDLKRVVGATPRAVKRYVNIYRLLRARVAKSRAAEFEGKPGEPREFEAVMYLLAMFNTAPIFAHRFCRELEQHGTAESAQKTAPSDLVETIRLTTPLANVIAGIDHEEETNEIETTLLKSIKLYLQGFKGQATQPNIDAYCRWHPVVSRYSFLGEAPGELATESKPVSAQHS